MKHKKGDIKMYLIVKTIKYETQKDYFHIVNNESFKHETTAHSYAYHLNDSEKKKNVYYTVIKLGE
tara:strand:+ start:2105 stop:2302 length:198 start_codon:yes stop_codon:yes gene_type:complete